MIMRDDTADNTYEGHLPDCEQYAVCETCDCAEIKLKARITELEAVLTIAESAMHEHDTACYEYDEENPWTMREWFNVSDREAIAKARLSVPPKNAALKEATK